MACETNRRRKLDVNDNGGVVFRAGRGFGEARPLRAGTQRGTEGLWLTEPVSAINRTEQSAATIRLIDRRLCSRVRLSSDVSDAIYRVPGGGLEPPRAYHPTDFKSCPMRLRQSTLVQKVPTYQCFSPLGVHVCLRFSTRLGIS